MIEIQPKNYSLEFDCPYLKGQIARNEYFFAMELSRQELDDLLSQGWRKFGWYFFRPSCPDCQACIPLRIPTEIFKMSRNQRKVINKNKDTSFSIGPPEFRDEIYELYEKHSRVRFQQTSDKQEFIETHFFPSCPTLQAEYHIENKLIAVGFLDYAKNSLSSVYFIYDTDYSHLSLGTFGALKEIEYARSLKLAHYYLGYWIDDNPSMRYKAAFKPHETYSWQSKHWDSKL